MSSCISRLDSTKKIQECTHYVYIEISQNYPHCSKRIDYDTPPRFHAKFKIWIEFFIRACPIKVYDIDVFGE